MNEFPVDVFKERNLDFIQRRRFLKLFVCLGNKIFVRHRSIIAHTRYLLSTVVRNQKLSIATQLMANPFFRCFVKA